ncbi:hypothetical protein KEM55_001482 [Ascosphaera atra]|nr:hypothetical protein KEM55_001482 [Ascosphaera atra]
MSPDNIVESPRKRRKITNQPETGPYVLRQLIDNVPVATEGDEDAHITCAEYWDGNLYIGTSAGEILHFVSLPPEPGSKDEEPSFMIASRLPIGTPHEEDSPGVQQILLVPASNKACILCNGIVTFYELPELSPTYRGTRLSSCNWIGELNYVGEGDDTRPVIMIAMKSRIMLVTIGSEPRKLRSIEFPGCLVASKRDSIACVADSHMYSLLEVEKREKIPLFSISSSDKIDESETSDTTASNTQSSRTDSPSLLAPEPHGSSHSRTPSSSTLLGSSPASGSPFPQRASSRGRNSGTFGSSPGPDQSPISKPLPAPPAARLKPHIVSPAPSEFLLLTGTEPDEPGVGMFVNVDGEVVRGTLEFDTYPESIVVDDHTEGSQAQASSIDQGGYVLAVLDVKNAEGEKGKIIEGRRWDMNPVEGDQHKFRLQLPASENEDTTVKPAGMRHALTPREVTFWEITDVLRNVRLQTFSTNPPSPPDPRTTESLEQYKQENELFDRSGTRPNSGEDWESQRNEEELNFAQGLSHVGSSILIWSRNRIWLVLRNPLALQLENTLRGAEKNEPSQMLIEVEPASTVPSAWDKDAILAFLVSLEDIEPKTESEFLGLRYVKQKASLLLFVDLLWYPDTQTTDMIQATENALMEGDLDPRIVLLLVPLLKDEVLRGPQGIWIYNGLAKIAQSYLDPETNEGKTTLATPLTSELLHMLRRYLLSWQKKRGYGSVTDETHVFDSVDAALLHLLLDMDHQNLIATSKHHHHHQSSAATLRQELYKLVDKWTGNFERAVALLEQYQRIFVLSRLYQSRKMAKQVLATWRRIAEGEPDMGGELPPPAVPAQVRKYLVKLRDAKLVEEYGTWLATRNPALGVEVFTDANSRVKFDPSRVIALLKARAPEAAVQGYLEHLVFAMGLHQYADDLIAYYLDSVISVLETSEEARQSLADSYETYRALTPPKPSYLSFITHNCPDEAWWGARLRLLQLLGGSTASQFSSEASRQLTNIQYSIPTVLSRIEPFQSVLVSESIILDGRQGRHREALHLLVHGLGDYDTAIRYCLVGSPASSLSVPSPTPAPPPPSTERPTPESTSPSTPPPQELFTYLLTEFLQIADPTERTERTSDLLERFAPMYDVEQVLALVPEDWAAQVLTGYLVRVLRGLVTEAHESKMQRALSAAVYLQVDVARIEGLEKCEWFVDEGDQVRPSPVQHKGTTTRHPSSQRT